MVLTAANSNKPAPTGQLPANIMHFARVLRDAGLPVGLGAVLDALAAVTGGGMLDIQYARGRQPQRGGFAGPDLHISQYGPGQGKDLQVIGA